MANNWCKLKFLTKVNSLNIKLVENEKGRWLHVLALLDSGTQMAARKNNDGRWMEQKWQITGAN